MSASVSPSTTNDHHAPASALSIHSLQTRILASVLILIVAIEAGGYLLIDTVGAASVRKTVGESVANGARASNGLSSSIPSA